MRAMRTTETEEFLQQNLQRIDGEIQVCQQQAEQIKQRLQSLLADKAKITHLLSDETEDEQKVPDGNDPD